MRQVIDTTRAYVRAEREWRRIRATLATGGTLTAAQVAFSDAWIDMMAALYAIPG